MNPFPPEDQQALERATAPASPGQIPRDQISGDPQFAALREGWVLFGQLLDAENPPWDEAAFLLGLRRRLARQQMIRRTAIAAMVGALVLSSAVWQWGRSSGLPVEDRPLARASNAPATNSQTASPTGDALAAPSSAAEQPAIVAVEGAESQLPDTWEDLDAEIEVAWVRLESARQNWNDPLTAINWLGERLNELEDDLEYSPL